MIPAFHKHIEREQFDYQTLLDVLRDYGRPRDKISADSLFLGGQSTIVTVFETGLDKFFKGRLILPNSAHAFSTCGRLWLGLF
jgi:hypothetical protein